MTVANPVSGARYAWIDVAKGFCITFIVFGHVVHSDMLAAVGGGGGWNELVRAFAPLRIPLFLFVSGYLAHSSMNRPLTSSFAKTGGLYALYVFWEVAFHVLQTMTQVVLDGARLDPIAWLSHVLGAVLLPQTLWYIWALPAYYLLSWWARRRFGERAAYAAIPLALLTILVPFVSLHPDGWVHFGETSLAPVLANALWFHLGLYGRDSWETLLTRASGLTFGLSALFYATTYLVARLSGADAYALIILAPIALLMATQCLGWADLQGRTARVLSRIGQLTLPVYVMHLFALSVLTAITKTAWSTAAATSMPLTYLLIIPPLATALLVWACRLVGRIILASPLRPILEPMRWPGRVEGKATAPSGA